jgi:integral membrane sensor domain MASE1
MVIKRFSASELVQPDWTEPRELALFILIAFFVASPIAALAGAAVYTYALLDPAPFIAFWRLWWFGDATGLITLTPALHMLFNFRVYWPDARYLSAGVAEWAGLIATTLLTCFLVFSVGITGGQMLAMTPLLVTLAPLWAALRLGPLPGSALAAAVVVYAAIATATGQTPFGARSPLLTQEVIVLFTVIVLFAAAFVSQNRRKSGSLRLYKSAVEATGEGVLITEAENDQPIIYCN